jgi:hypothetical protein
MGMAKSVRAAYDAWRRMIRRCSDPTDKDWKNYGGRGVMVCPEWRSSFRTFLKDVGPKPAPDRLLWLGRRDTRENYEPGNVAWLTHQRQISHRRYCHRIPPWQGPTIEELARAIGLPGTTLRGRLLRQKIDLSRAISLAPLPYRKTSKFLTLDGQTLSVPEWAKLLGVRLRTLRERVRRGASPKQALRSGDLRKPDSSRCATP